MIWLNQRHLMSALNARVGRTVLALIIAFGLLGCENMKRADQADGLLDFAMMLAGKAKPDVAPIEKATTGDGEIAAARAVAYRGGTLVRGSVRKRTGAGWVSGAYSHVDLLVLNAHRHLIESQTTKFSPSDIPNTDRGTEGRSYYSATLAAIPAPGSFIRILFHNIPMKECKHYLQPSRSTKTYALWDNARADGRHWRIGHAEGRSSLCDCKDLK